MLSNVAHGALTFSIKNFMSTINASQHNFVKNHSGSILDLFLSNMHATRDIVKLGITGP